MAKAAKGFVLYQEDLETLNEVLDGAQAFAVVLALGEYARSGEMPDADALTPAGMMAFTMMRKKVDASLKNFADISEKRANAAKVSKTSKCMQNEQMHANEANDSKPSKQGESESDTESESESDTESDSPKKRKSVKRTRFVPPTPEEVQTFFLANEGTHVQAVRFHTYYGSNGWKVGKNPMKDWQAAARGWMLRDKESGQSPPYAGRATAKSAPKGSGDIMLRYSAEDRKKTYSAAVVDFDEEG